MQPTTLTKSRFAVALVCPRKLAYAADPAYVNAGQENDFLAALADGGHQVGALARLMHPEGIEITGKTTEAQVKETDALLERDSVTLFEPTISVGNLLVRIDILVKRGNAVELIEVKSKGFDPKRKSMHAKNKKNHPVDGEWRPYLYDVAFQTYVSRRARPKWKVTPYLLLPDPTAAASIDGVGTALPVHHVGRSVTVEPKPDFDVKALKPPLLKRHEVSELVEEVLATAVDADAGPTAFEKFVKDLSARLAKGEDPEPSPGPKCRKCEFVCAPAERGANRRSGWAECFERVTGGAVDYPRSETIFALYNFKKIDALLAKGRLRLDGVEPEDLDLKEETGTISATERHHLQLSEAQRRNPGVRLARNTLQKEFQRWEYPLHFIDFETARPVLPFHKGLTPYRQILFQFSHHVLGKDGSLAHKTQCLNATPGLVSSFDTVRALHKALGKKGTVVHWFTHERTVLGDMKQQIKAAKLPDADELVAFLDTLGVERDSRGRLADLGTLVSNTVFLPGSGGSSSIKKFLPAVLRESAWVRERYGAPIYGTKAMPSLNFPAGWTWVKETASREIDDPYNLLAPLFLDPEITEAIAAGEEEGDESDFVKNGGAAMLAYATLQDQDTDAAVRQRLDGQLKRYCELDSLAMVMVYEALQDWLKPRK